MDQHCEKKNCFSHFTLAKKTDPYIRDSQKNGVKKSNESKPLDHTRYKFSKVFERRRIKNKSKNRPNKTLAPPPQQESMLQILMESAKKTKPVTTVTKKAILPDTVPDLKKT